MRSSRSLFVVVAACQRRPMRAPRRAQIGRHAPVDPHARKSRDTMRCAPTQVGALYRGLGGGGLGTPVVSYAPLPKLKCCSDPVTIMVTVVMCGCGGVVV